MPARRILQVFTFYEAYTERFFSQRPELSGRPYEEQLQTLYCDGFSNIHIFAPYLTKLGYDARFVIANCPQLQAQWLRQYGKRSVDAKDWMNEVLRQQVEHYEPDVLYILNPIQFDSKFVKGLAKRPKLVMGWRAAEIPPGTDWREFDLIVSHLSVCHERALQLGAKAVEPFQPAVPEDLIELVGDCPVTADVVFSGQWTAQHDTRNKLLTAVARDAAVKGYSVDMYLAGATEDLPPEVKAVNRGPVFGMDMYRALRSGRIVLNAEINLARGEAGNMRLFETTGVGSFLLTQHHENIGKYFEPGKEIETFRTTEELLAKIALYLANPEKRESIAAAGRSRCNRDHSMRAWAKNLSDLISRYIDGTGPFVTSSPSSSADSAKAVPSLALLRLRQDSSPLPSWANFDVEGAERLEVAYRKGAPEAALLSGVSDVLALGKSDLVYISCDHLTPSVGSLEDARRKLADSPAGVAVLRLKMSEGAEARHPSDLRAVLEGAGELYGPEHVLPLFVFRRERLRQILYRLSINTPTGTDFTDALLSTCLDGAIFLPGVVTLRPELTPRAMADAAISSLNSNDAVFALETLDRLKGMRFDEPDIEYFRAVAFAKQGRLVEARLSAEAHSRRFPADKRASDLLGLMQNELAPYETLEYDAFAAAIESIPGYMVPGQEKVLFTIVRSLPRDAVILEIGSCFGRSTAAMAFACLGSNRRIFAIDTFVGNAGAMGLSEDFSDIFVHNLSRFHLEDRVSPIKGYSHPTLERWGDKPRLDFVFIDGSHEYQDVLRDFELSYALVKEGGWIAFHDVEPSWPGSWRVWREFGVPLLANHFTFSTLAGGRKQHGIPFTGVAPMSFSYSAEWIRSLRETRPELCGLADALDATTSTHTPADKLSWAEGLISRMPDDKRREIRNMVSKEAGSDPWLHYWAILSAVSEEESGSIADRFEKVLAMSETPGLLRTRLLGLREILVGGARAARA